MKPPRSPQTMAQGAMPSGRLVAQIIPAHEVSPSMRQEMFALFERYYELVDEDTFVRDMSAKDEVIILRDSGDGSLRGFCTLLLKRGEHQGRVYYTLFTGDTIVDKPYWGQTVFHQAFIWHWAKIAWRLKAPVYWLLITKGYKTYLIFARNCPEHWPRYDKPTPAWEQGMIHDASHDHFGATYMAKLGVVREGEHQPRLKPGIAGVDEVEAIEPDIDFFMKANPDHASGDQLVCAARMTWDLIPHMVLRHSVRKLRRRLGQRLTR